MLNGSDLYAELAVTHPLLHEYPPKPKTPFSFETFPHAIACSWSDDVVSAKGKREDRGRILRGAGVDISGLTNIDWIDAGLCAWVAHLMATRQPCKPYGNAESGFIIVPAPYITPG